MHLAAAATLLRRLGTTHASSSWAQLAGGPAWRAKRSLVISSPRAHPLGALASRRPLACAIDQQSHEYGMDRGLGGRGVAGTGRRMQPCSLAMAPRAISFKFISFAIYLYLIIWPTNGASMFALKSRNFHVNQRKIEK